LAADQRQPQEPPAVAAAEQHAVFCAGSQQADCSCGAQQPACFAAGLAGLVGSSCLDRRTGSMVMSVRLSREYGQGYRRGPCEMDAVSPRMECRADWRGCLVHR
jgi:hypothetical protein